MWWPMFASCPNRGGSRTLVRARSHEFTVRKSGVSWMREGLLQTQILASGNLDEYQLRRLEDSLLFDVRISQPLQDLAMSVDHYK